MTDPNIMTVKEIEWFAMPERDEWACRALGFFRVIQIRSDGGKWHCMRANRSVTKGFSSHEAAMEAGADVIRKVATEGIVNAEERLHDSIEAAEAVGAPMP